MRVSCWKLREQKHSDTSQKQAWPCGGRLLASSVVSLRFREHISSRTRSEQNKSQVQDPVVFCPWYIIKTDNHSQRNKAKRSPRAHGWTNYLTRWFYVNGHDKFLWFSDWFCLETETELCEGKVGKLGGTCIEVPNFITVRWLWGCSPSGTVGNPHFILFCTQDSLRLYFPMVKTA